MRYSMVLLGMGGLALSGLAAAECTDEQRARMIQNDIPQEKIDELCGQPSEERERRIEININNTNINRNAPGGDSQPQPQPETAVAAAEAEEQAAPAEEGTFKPWVIGVQGSGLRYGTKDLIRTGFSDSDHDDDDDDDDDESHDGAVTAATSATSDGDVQYDGAMKGAFARANFTDNWAVQGSYYRGGLSGDGGSVDVSGYTGHLLLGANFGYTGGNAYLGVGGFREDWSGWAGDDTRHQGMSGLVGLEYKWDHYMVAVEGSYRKPKSYGDALAEQHGVDSADVSAVTATAKFGFRFGG